MTDLKSILIETVARCEFCGQRAGWYEQHEIARGTFREEARELRFASLLLCKPCHDCLHRMAGDDQRALGLNLVNRSRHQDYNLHAFWDLTDREFPSADLVSLWSKRLAWVTER